MDAQVGSPDPPLKKELVQAGFRFEFFQAVRLLERLFPARKPVGGTAAPSDEVVRFASHLSLVFPASAIHEIQDETKDLRTGVTASPRMTVAFMGLTGLLGVLPRHYTSFLIQRASQKDFAARAFIDLFMHRLVSLFYRAWEKYRFVCAYERSARQKAQPDPFTESLYALAGLGLPALRIQNRLRGRAVLFYAGLLAQRPHSAASVEGILKDYFRVPVSITQFMGQWVSLGREDWTSLRGHDGNNQLGTTAILGESVWETQTKFRVQMGPLSYQEYCQFIPGGSAFDAVRELTRFAASPELEFDIRLLLKAAEVPVCQLGQGGPCAPRLGWSTWLSAEERTRTADDLILAA